MSVKQYRVTVDITLPDSVGKDSVSRVFDRVLRKSYFDAKKLEVVSVEEKHVHALTEVERLRKVVEKLLASATPHHREHPTMTAAWEYARSVLSELDSKKPLSKEAENAKKRPENYEQLSARDQWEVDKGLGILDWDGS